MRGARTLLVATLLGWAACGGATGAVEGDEAPEEQAPTTYDERVRARLTAAREHRVHAVRYNPTTCGCPPYEIRLQEHWQRVAFDVVDEQDPVLVALQQAVSEDSGEAGQVYVVQGELDSSLVTCGRGALVVTLEPVAFGPPEEPEVE